MNYINYEFIGILQEQFILSNEIDIPFNMLVMVIHDILRVFKGRYLHPS